MKHLGCRALLSLTAPIIPLHLDVFRYVGFERMKVYLPRRGDKRALVSISAWGDSHRGAQQLSDASWQPRTFHNFHVTLQELNSFRGEMGDNGKERESDTQRKRPSRQCLNECWDLITTGSVVDIWQGEMRNSAIKKSYYIIKHDHVFDTYLCDARLPRLITTRTPARWSISANTHTHTYNITHIR